MSLREAAQALIDDYDNVDVDAGQYRVHWPQMEALRDALAEAEKAEPVAWTPVTTRLPPYGDEKKVVCYTEGHDYAGTQFITLRASDFYEYDPDESDEPGTPEAKTMSHWIYEDDLIAAARGKG